MVRQKGKGLIGFAGIVNSPLLHTQDINYNVNIDFDISNSNYIKDNLRVLNKF